MISRKFFSRMLASQGVFTKSPKNLDSPVLKPYDVDGI